MVRKTIQIGKEEKHLVEVEVSQWTGKARIIIDGNEVAYDSVLTSKSFNFVVGINEKHNLTVKIGGVVTPIIDFYVDQNIATSASQGSKNTKRSVVEWIIIIILTLMAGIAGYVFMQYLLTSLFG
jgi:hypothetical protein